MRIIYKRKDKDLVVVDKIKKENLVYFYLNSSNKKIRSLEDEKVDGFFDKNCQNFYYYRDFYDIANFGYMDFIYCNNTIRDQEYENIYLNKTILEKNNNKDFYNDLNEIKEDKRLLNKKQLNLLLKNKFIIFNNNKFKRDLEEEQNMVNIIVKYFVNEQLEIEEPIIWHAFGKENELWDIKDFMLLYKEIKIKNQPYKKKLREYEELICKCQSVEELNAIDFIYE